MEGLAVPSRPDRPSSLTMISDDNFSMLQRTILLQFRLDEAARASAGQRADAAGPRPAARPTSARRRERAPAARAAPSRRNRPSARLCHSGHGPCPRNGTGTDISAMPAKAIEKNSAVSRAEPSRLPTSGGATTPPPQAVLKTVTSRSCPIRKAVPEASAIRGVASRSTERPRSRTRPPPVAAPFPRRSGGS